jgi:hypothetical protein
MPGYSFVTTDDLKTYMSGIGLSTDQADAMQDVLDGLQRELERHCQRRFERKERTEILEPDVLGRLWPEAVPIVSVSVPDPDATGLWLDVSRRAIVGFRSQLTLAGIPESVEVTYVGGLDPDSDDLQDVKTAILRVAAREATTRHDDVIEINNLEARDVEDQDKQPLGFQPAELKKFDRLRRRTVVSG